MFLKLGKMHHSEGNNVLVVMSVCRFWCWCSFYSNDIILTNKQNPPLYIIIWHYKHLFNFKDKSYELCQQICTDITYTSRNARDHFIVTGNLTSKVLTVKCYVFLTHIVIFPITFKCTLDQNLTHVSNCKVIPCEMWRYVVYKQTCI